VIDITFMIVAVSKAFILSDACILARDGTRDNTSAD